MMELVRSNDLVLIDVVQTILREAGIPAFVADNHMSAIEGSIGAFQRRVMVASDRIEAARRLMREAGLGEELRHA